MVNPKIGILLGAVGVLVVLLPIVALFLTGGYNSPIQQFYDRPLAPGLPAGLILTLAGAAITAVGLVLFVRGMRTLSPYSSPLGPPRISRRSEKSPEELEEIEREISSFLDDNRPTMEIRTMLPRPRQQSVGQQAVVAKSKTTEPKLIVVTRGVDMVCKSCGAVNPIGSKICSACSAELFKPDPKATVCPVCGAPLDESYKIGENIVCGLCFSELKYVETG
ncbi:MAG: zinc ribbon domain-containing protein [Candidatus Caldarchaeum sp.]